jgi:hypothetical protein
MCVLLALLVTAAPAVEVTRPLEYHGWRDAWRLSNSVVEVVLVPSIGRVMGFGFVGGANVLWANPKFVGQVRASDFPDWFNAGGDKVWPAEQAQWFGILGRWWPPDRTWDGGAWSAERLPDGAVRLTSAVSPDYGLRAERTFRLSPTQASLTIAQRYVKVAGPPRRCSVWNVSQTVSPDAAFLPLSPLSELVGGFHRFDREWPNHTVHGGVLEITRLGDASTKYGVDHGAWVAWVKGGLLFSEHCAPRPGAYPDRGCSAEVYTEQDTNGPMVELELLSPQQTLAVGQSMDWDIEWRLAPFDAVLRGAERAAAVWRRMGPAWFAQPRTATQTRRSSLY